MIRRTILAGLLAMFVSTRALDEAQLSELNHDSTSDITADMSYSDESASAASLDEPAAFDDDDDTDWARVAAAHARDNDLRFSDSTSASSAWQPRASLPSWDADMGVGGDWPNVTAQCQLLRDTIADKGNLTDLLTEDFRTSYLTRELPFSGQYYGRHALSHFAYKVAHSLDVSAHAWEVHDVDDVQALCVLKSTVSGTFMRSGKDFSDVDHYWEFKLMGPKRFVGVRIFDGKKGGEWVQAYRTDAQSRALNLSAAIFSNGYRSKRVRGLLSNDTRVMLFPNGYSRYGPQKFHGKRAIARAVDFVRRAMRRGSSWRGHHHHDCVGGECGDEDEDEGMGMEEEHHGRHGRRHRRHARHHGRHDPHHRRRRAGPFPLPLPYTGHYCDIQYTNDTVVAGTCILGHPRLHARRRHGHGLGDAGDAAFEDDNDDDDDEEDCDAVGVGHHGHCRGRLMGEVYLRGYMTYFNMRFGKNGTLDRVVLMPLQPAQPGHGFRTMRARTPSDTANDNTVIDRHNRFSVMRGDDEQPAAARAVAGLLGCDDECMREVRARANEEEAGAAAAARTAWRRAHRAVEAMTEDDTQ